MRWLSKASQSELDNVVSPRASEMLKSSSCFYVAAGGSQVKQRKRQEAQRPRAEGRGGIPRAQST